MQSRFFILYDRTPELNNQLATAVEARPITDAVEITPAVGGGAVVACLAATGHPVIYRVTESVERVVALLSAPGDTPVSLTLSTQDDRIALRPVSVTDALRTQDAFRRAGRAS